MLDNILLSVFNYVLLTLLFIAMIAPLKWNFLEPKIEELEKEQNLIDEDQLQPLQSIQEAL